MNNKKNRNIWIPVILGLMLLVTISGCVNDEKKDNGTLVPQETPSKDTSSKDTPKGVSSSTGSMLEKYDIKKLISMSDNIVIGDVSDVLPSRWNTQDGKRPINTNDGKPYVIYTDNNIKIEESLKGSLGTSTILVRTLGGTVDRDGQSVEDEPSYSVNEKLLIFLKDDNNFKTKDFGDKHFVTVGNIQGKISILQNNVVIGGEKMSLDDVRIKIAEDGKESQ